MGEDAVDGDHCGPEDAVEHRVVDLSSGGPAGQVDGPFRSDAVGHAVELRILGHEVGEHRLGVLLGSRHDLDLGVQRPLIEGRPDRDRVLLLTGEAEVPLPRRRPVGHRLALCVHEE